MSAALPPELSPRPRSRSGTGRRWLSLLATVVASVVFVTSVGGWALATYYDGKIPRIPGLGTLLSPGDVDGPMTVLVAGSDSRAGLDAGQRHRLHTGNAAGQRSDVMMLVHLSGDHQTVTVVSLPRDSYVTIPAWTDSSGKKHAASKNKLNAAYSYGGAPLLIRTVEQNTGVDIDHYIEVGFAGVIKTVDALGGVTVCLPSAVNDKRSGLSLPAGRSHVDGQMGLAFVRARYIDPTADLGRMARQQQFLGAMFRKATSAGVLLNPVKLDGFLKAALSSVKTDEGLDQNVIMGLASDLQQLQPKDITFLTVPIKDAGYETPAGEAVLWDTTKADAVFTSFQDDTPLVHSSPSKVTVAPSAISVKVLNGSAVTGLATQATTDLSGQGYQIAAPPGNADGTDTTQTVITYDPRWSDSLQTMKAAFPGADFQPVDGQGATFVVTVGTDYAAPQTVRVAKPTKKLQTTSAASNPCG
jgi:LCP family protein required for cell wall assembly